MSDETRRYCPLKTQNPLLDGMNDENSDVYCDQEMCEWFYSDAYMATCAITALSLTLSRLLGFLAG